jgi:hypothetical protein
MIEMYEVFQPDAAWDRLHEPIPTRPMDMLAGPSLARRLAQSQTSLPLLPIERRLRSRARCRPPCARRERRDDPRRGLVAVAWNVAFALVSVGSTARRKRSRTPAPTDHSGGSAEPRQPVVAIAQAVSRTYLR